MLSCGGGLSPRRLVGDMLGFEPSVEELVEALFSDVLKQRNEVNYFRQKSLDSEAIREP